MSRTEVKQHAGPRYLVSLPVRAEWNEKRTGKHVITEGTTENVGPTGAVVHLEQLPTVGSRIIISIQGAGGPKIRARAEVVRLVRDIRQPLVSLSVVDARDEWRGKVWEPAGTLASRRAKAEEDSSD